MELHFISIVHYHPQAIFTFFFPFVDLYVSLLGPGHLFVQYPSASEVSFVRRRCWQPSFYTDGDEAGVRDRAPTSLLQNKARVCGLVGSPGLPRPYKSCENITILVFFGDFVKLIFLV